MENQVELGDIFSRKKENIKKNIPIPQVRKGGGSKQKKRKKNFDSMLEAERGTNTHSLPLSFDILIMLVFEKLMSKWLIQNILDGSLVGLRRNQYKFQK